MNFRVFIQNLYLRCIGIIWSPKEDWARIKDVNDSLGQILVGFMLPLLLISAVTSMIGGYIHRGDTAWYSELLIIFSIRPVLSISLSIALSIPAINVMIGTFGGTPNFSQVSQLVIFSFFPVTFVTIILGMSPEIYIVGLFALYTFYIMHIGTQILSDIPSERQSNFSTLSSTMMLVTYLIINFILSAFFGAIH